MKLLWLVTPSSLFYQLLQKHFQLGLPSAAIACLQGANVKEPMEVSGAISFVYLMISSEIIEGKL